MQLDQAKENGTLAKLKRPLYVFTGLQFEEVKPVDGDVILVGDCAKPLRERFPDAQILGQLGRVPELHSDLGQHSGAVHFELHSKARRKYLSELSGARGAESCAGHSKCDIKDSDIRILTLEQCRDAADKGLHAGGAFSATIPLVALFYGGFIDIDVADPHARGRICSSSAKGTPSQRWRPSTPIWLFRQERPLRLAGLAQYSERPSRTCAARNSDRHRSDGPGPFRRAGFRARRPQRPEVRFLRAHRRRRTAGRYHLGSRDVRGLEASRQPLRAGRSELRPARHREPNHLSDAAPRRRLHILRVASRRRRCHPSTTASARPSISSATGRATASRRRLSPWTERLRSLFGFHEQT